MGLHVHIHIQSWQQGHKQLLTLCRSLLTRGQPQMRAAAHSSGKHSHTVSSLATVTIISCIPKNILPLTLVTCVFNGPDFEQPQYTNSVDAQNTYLLWWYCSVEMTHFSNDLIWHFMFEFPCIISLYYIKNQQDATLTALFVSHCK